MSGNNSKLTKKQIEKKIAKELKKEEKQKEEKQKELRKEEKVIIHVGYTLNITEEVKTLVKGYVPDYDVNMTPITAYHYRDGQDLMSEWYRKKSKIATMSYLRGLYIDPAPKPKYAVGHFTIDATHTWVILCKGTEIAPIKVKEKVSQGFFGKEIPVDRMSVPCTAYKFEV